jgi:hypothetical protein
MSNDRRSAIGERGQSAVELLPQLKREGCNLLISGSVSEATANYATQRLFGSPDIERQRVLVRTEDATPVSELLPAGISLTDADVRVVQYRADDDEDALASLARRITETVDAADSRSSPLLSAELRLVVTSLKPIIVDHDVLAAEQFLRSVTDAVSDVRGMGHYRYDGPRAGLSALPIERLFDAFVDLRDRPHTEQRLSIPHRRSTGWLDL